MNNRDKNIVGQILAKTYRIERFLGVGTVGTVYVARHVRSGGLYAVKVLHRKLAASPDLYQRFQDEARLIATLRHPHILPITDFDRDENGIPFFVMELLEGENLQQRLKHKEVLPVAQALEIVQQVGSALHTAHRSGIVHRNIKPENLFLVRHDLGDRVTETTKITDFGLARFRRMAPAGTRDASLGVSPYMAPEMLQETTTPIDGRADQWALAVITYRIVSGKPPWEDDDPEKMLTQILNDPPKPLPKTTPEMPAHMVAAISRGMSKRREDRYETLMDFVRALTSRPTSELDKSGSGRVGAPMPPMTSGGAVPPPLPPGAGAPAGGSASSAQPAVPAVASGAAPQAGNLAAPNAPRPVAAAPSGPVQSAGPSAASPPAPPPNLKRPSLLISQEFKVPSIPPPRAPSMGLLIGGGILAVLAGVGLTLLWEQRHRPKPLPPIVQTTKPEDGNGKVVVEPLPPGTPEGTEPPTPETPPPPKYPARPGVPPLRGFEDVVPPTTQQPATQPGAVPGTPPAVVPGTPGQPTAPTAVPPTGQTPTTMPPAVPGTQPVRPPGTVPAVVPGTQPGMPQNPTQVPPRPLVPGTPGQVQPTVPPPATAPVATPPQPTLSPQQQKSRDEVDDLIGGNSNPPATPPVQARPTVPPRAPNAARPPEAAAPPEEKTADKIMEEAQAAYVSGERQKAIEMAMQVTRRSNPNEVLRAWRFIGSAACSLRSTTLATRAYNSLADPSHRQLLTELCKRNGLNFVDGNFVAE